MLGRDVVLIVAGDLKDFSKIVLLVAVTRQSRVGALQTVRWVWTELLLHVGEIDVGRVGGAVGGYVCSWNGVP